MEIKDTVKAIFKVLTFPLVAFSKILGMTGVHIILLVVTILDRILSIVWKFWIVFATVYVIVGFASHSMEKFDFYVTIGLTVGLLFIKSFCLYFSMFLEDFSYNAINVCLPKEQTWGDKFIDDGKPKSTKHDSIDGLYPSSPLPSKTEQQIQEMYDQMKEMQKTLQQQNVQNIAPVDEPLIEAEYEEIPQTTNEVES